MDINQRLLLWLNLVWTIFLKFSKCGHTRAGFVDFCVTEASPVVSSSPCTQLQSQAGISFMALLSLHPHRSWLHSPRLPPPFYQAYACLLPPLGGCTDAGWRHSGLNLLLLMLMLKEAIGTCYFCCYPQLPGANKEVLIDRLIRHWVMAHGVLLKGEWREKQTLRNKLLCNCTGKMKLENQQKGKKTQEALLKWELQETHL